jgi:hypothetical protein
VGHQTDSLSLCRNNNEGRTCAERGRRGTPPCDDQYTTFASKATTWPSSLHQSDLIPASQKIGSRLAISACSQCAVLSGVLSVRTWVAKSSSRFCTAGSARPVRR